MNATIEELSKIEDAIAYWSARRDKQFIVLPESREAMHLADLWATRNRLIAERDAGVKVRFDINDVIRMLEFRNAVNSVPLEQIEWMDGETALSVDPAWLEDFRFIGLSNVNFIESSIRDGDRLVTSDDGSGSYYRTMCKRKDES